MKKILTIIIIFLTMFASAPVSAYTENACYQCNSHNNVYKWGSNSDADSSCPGGYHKVSGSEMECLNKGASYKSVSCAGFDDIPAALPKFISNIVNLIKILTPIILIIMGMTDFLKSVVANDDKGMNEGKTRLIKRTISGVVVFVVVSIVQLVFSAIGTEDARSVATCINCFVNGNCNPVPVDTRKYCSDYRSEGTCEFRDDYGNLCKWYVNRCSVVGTAQKCEDKYTTSSSCDGKYDDYGYVCKWENNTCKQSEVGKYCSEYSYEECPDQDAHGYICIKGTSGGRPACIASSRNNVIENDNSSVNNGSKSCSEYATLSECNDATDSDGNKCLWHVLDSGKSGTCEIDDISTECSDYTTLRECNDATDSDGNKCLWNISGICEIEDPNALG